MLPTLTLSASPCMWSPFNKHLLSSLPLPCANPPSYPLRQVFTMMYKIGSKSSRMASLRSHGKQQWKRDSNLTLGGGCTQTACLEGQGRGIHGILRPSPAYCMETVHKTDLPLHIFMGALASFPELPKVAFSLGCCASACRNIFHDLKKAQAMIKYIKGLLELKLMA